MDPNMAFYQPMPVDMLPILLGAPDMDYGRQSPARNAPVQYQGVQNTHHRHSPFQSDAHPQLSHDSNMLRTNIDLIEHRLSALEKDKGNLEAYWKRKYYALEDRYDQLKDRSRMLETRLESVESALNDARPKREKRKEEKRKRKSHDESSAAEKRSKTGESTNDTDNNNASEVVVRFDKSSLQQERSPHPLDPLDYDEHFEEHDFYEADAVEDEEDEEIIIEEHGDEDEPLYEEFVAPHVINELQNMVKMPHMRGQMMSNGRRVENIQNDRALIDRMLAQPTKTRQSKEKAVIGEIIVARRVLRGVPQTSLENLMSGVFRQSQKCATCEVSMSNFADFMDHVLSTLHTTKNTVTPVDLKIITARINGLHQ